MTLIDDPAAASADQALETLGVKIIVNACGCYTDLGGSILSDSVWAALTELNRGYVDLVSLLTAAGERIADLVGAEAARVTPGASAGIALSTAAAMAGSHGPNWERLPDTSGMRDAILLQRPQANRYQYLNPIRISGAQPVFAGTDDRTTVDDLRAAIGPQTAALFVPAHLDDLYDVLSMEELAVLAHEHGLPLLVDAAYQVFPPQSMKRFAALGADLTMFSSKYYDGPNAGGFVSGAKAMIDIVAGLDFTTYESGPYRTFGRPFKMGRYDVAAVALALQEWFAMDHPARLARQETTARAIADALHGVGGLVARPCGFTLDERIVEAPVNAALVLSPSGAPAPGAILETLAAGDPPIYAIPTDGGVVFNAEALRPGDERVIISRVTDLMARAGAR